MKKFNFITLICLISATVFAVTPDYYSAQTTLLNAGDSIALWDSSSVKVLYFSYTSATTLSNKTIALARLPAHCRIVGGEINLEAMGNSATFDVGLVGADGRGYINSAGTTADDIDLFIDGGSCAAVARYTFASFENAGAALSASAIQTVSVEGDPVLTLQTASIEGDPVLTLEKNGSNVTNVTVATTTYTVVTNVTVATTAYDLGTNVTTTADTSYVINSNEGITLDKDCFLTVTAPSDLGAPWVTTKVIKGVVYYINN